MLLSVCSQAVGMQTGRTAASFPLSLREREWGDRMVIRWGESGGLGSPPCSRSCNCSRANQHALQLVCEMSAKTPHQAPRPRLQISACKRLSATITSVWWYSESAPVSVIAYQRGGDAHRGRLECLGCDQKLQRAVSARGILAVGQVQPRLPGTAV